MKRLENNIERRASRFMAANAMDERVALLTLVCRSRWFSSLSTEELKLYLLLLVSAVRIDEEGQIAWEVLKRGLGESLTVAKIDRLGEALGRHGLARVRVTHPAGADRHERGDATLLVYSTVFSLGRLRGQASRSRRREREKSNG